MGTHVPTQHGAAQQGAGRLTLISARPPSPLAPACAQMQDLPIALTWALLLGPLSQPVGRDVHPTLWP